jgi:hypothetical protein
MIGIDPRPRIEWEVWLADGSTLDSGHTDWDDPWDHVLVLRWWKGRQKGICYGDSNYGLHGTIKNGAIVADDVFSTALEEAHGRRNPPSQR